MCVVHTYAYACWWPIMAIFHFLPFHTFLYYYFFCPLANHTHDAKVMKAQWPVKFYGRKKNCSLHLNELGFLRCKTRRWRSGGWCCVVYVIIKGYYGQHELLDDARPAKWVWFLSESSFLSWEFILYHMDSFCVILHRIASYHIVSYHIVMYHIVLNRFVLYHIVSYCIIW